MNHEKYMLRAIQLANAGKGTVSPNPLVGSVIVSNGNIIGEGYHHHCGGPHAEVMAINSVRNKSLLRDSQIYVVLEPCSHFGNTPPCANLILEHKIPKVIISCLDPHEKVAGKGIKLLKENGVEVIENVLSNEGEWLNRRFFTFHRKKRPYIILKWAQSKDGFIDIDRNTIGEGVHWITKPQTKTLTHKWRFEEDSILIGKNTAINDDPTLTARNYNGKSPMRIVIDKNLNLSSKSNVLNKDALTLIFNDIKNDVIDNVQFIKINEGNNYIDAILDYLYKINIQSIIIEGGAYTITQFIKRNLWDEARVLTGISNIYHGLIAPRIKGSEIKTFMYGKDQISIYNNTYNQKRPN